MTFIVFASSDLSSNNFMYVTLALADCLAYQSSCYRRQLGLPDSSVFFTASLWSHSLQRLSENVVIKSSNHSAYSFKLLVGSELVDKLMRHDNSITLLLQLTEKSLGIAIAETSINFNLHEISSHHIYKIQWYATGFVGGVAVPPEGNTFSVSVHIHSNTSPPPLDSSNSKKSSCLVVRAYPGSWYLESGMGHVYVTVTDITLNEDILNLYENKVLLVRLYCDVNNDVGDEENSVLLGYIAHRHAIWFESVQLPSSFFQSPSSLERVFKVQFATVHLSKNKQYNHSISIRKELEVIELCRGEATIIGVTNRDQIDFTNNSIAVELSTMLFDTLPFDDDYHEEEGKGSNNNHELSSLQVGLMKMKVTHDLFVSSVRPMLAIRLPSLLQSLQQRPHQSDDSSNLVDHVFENLLVHELFLSREEAMLQVSLLLRDLCFAPTIQQQQAAIALSSGNNNNKNKKKVSLGSMAGQLQQQRQMLMLSMLSYLSNMTSHESMMTLDEVAGQVTKVLSLPSSSSNNDSNKSSKGVTKVIKVLQAAFHGWLASEDLSSLMNPAHDNNLLEIDDDYEDDDSSSFEKSKKLIKRLSRAVLLLLLLRSLSHLQSSNNGGQNNASTMSMSNLINDDNNNSAMFFEEVAVDLLSILATHQRHLLINPSDHIHHVIVEQVGELKRLLSNLVHSYDTNRLWDGEMTAHLLDAAEDVHTVILSKFYDNDYGHRQCEHVAIMRRIAVNELQVLAITMNHINIAKDSLSNNKTKRKHSNDEVRLTRLMDSFIQHMQALSSSSATNNSDRRLLLEKTRYTTIAAIISRLSLTFNHTDKESRTIAKKLKKADVSDMLSSLANQIRIDDSSANPLSGGSTGNNTAGVSPLLSPLLSPAVASVNHGSEGSGTASAHNTPPKAQLLPSPFGTSGSKTMSVAEKVSLFHTPPSQRNNLSSSFSFSSSQQRTTVGGGHVFTFEPLSSPSIGNSSNPFTASFYQRSSAHNNPIGSGNQMQSDPSSSLGAVRGVRLLLSLHSNSHLIQALLHILSSLEMDNNISMSVIEMDAVVIAKQFVSSLLFAAVGNAIDPMAIRQLVFNLCNGPAALDTSIEVISGVRSLLRLYMVVYRLYLSFFLFHFNKNDDDITVKEVIKSLSVVMASYHVIYDFTALRSSSSSSSSSSRSSSLYAMDMNDLIERQSLRSTAISTIDSLIYMLLGDQMDDSIDSNGAIIMVLEQVISIRRLLVGLPLMLRVMVAGEKEYVITSHRGHATVLFDAAFFKEQLQVFWGLLTLSYREVNKNNHVLKNNVLFMYRQSVQILILELVEVTVFNYDQASGSMKVLSNSSGRNNSWQRKMRQQMRSMFIQQLLVSLANSSDNNKDTKNNNSGLESASSLARQLVVNQDTAGQSLLLESMGKNIKRQTTANVIADMLSKLRTMKLLDDTSTTSIDHNLSHLVLEQLLAIRCAAHNSRSNDLLDMIKATGLSSLCLGQLSQLHDVEQSNTYNRHDSNVSGVMVMIKRAQSLLCSSNMNQNHGGNSQDDSNVSNNSCSLSLKQVMGQSQQAWLTLLQLLLLLPYGDNSYNNNNTNDNSTVMPFTANNHGLLGEREVKLLRESLSQLSHTGYWEAALALTTLCLDMLSSHSHNINGNSINNSSGWVAESAQNSPIIAPSASHLFNNNKNSTNTSPIPPPPQISRFSPSPVPSSSNDNKSPSTSGSSSRLLFRKTINNNNNNNNSSSRMMLSSPGKRQDALRKELQRVAGKLKDRIKVDGELRLSPSYFALRLLSNQPVVSVMIDEDQEGLKRCLDGLDVMLLSAADEENDDKEYSNEQGRWHEQWFILQVDAAAHHLAAMTHYRNYLNHDNVCLDHPLTMRGIINLLRQSLSSSLDGYNWLPAQWNDNNDIILAAAPFVSYDVDCKVDEEEMVWKFAQLIPVLPQAMVEKGQALLPTILSHDNNENQDEDDHDSDENEQNNDMIIRSNDVNDIVDSRGSAGLLPDAAHNDDNDNYNDQGRKKSTFKLPKDLDKRLLSKTWTSAPPTAFVAFQLHSRSDDKDQEDAAEPKEVRRLSLALQSAVMTAKQLLSSQHQSSDNHEREEGLAMSALSLSPLAIALPIPSRSYAISSISACCDVLLYHAAMLSQLTRALQSVLSLTPTELANQPGQSLLHSDAMFYRCYAICCDLLEQPMGSSCAISLLNVDYILTLQRERHESRWQAMRKQAKREYMRSVSVFEENKAATPPAVTGSSSHNAMNNHNNINSNSNGRPTLLSPPLTPTNTTTANNNNNHSYNKPQLKFHPSTKKTANDNNNDDANNKPPPEPDLNQLRQQFEQEVNLAAVEQLQQLRDACFALLERLLKIMRKIATRQQRNNSNKPEENEVETMKRDDEATVKLKLCLHVEALFAAVEMGLDTM